MNYFARSVYDYLVDQITNFRLETSLGRKMIFTMPSMPEDMLLAIAEMLQSYSLQHADIKLELKIASELTEKWSSQGQEKVQDHSWYAEKSLTYYRNLPEHPHMCTVIILCGSDCVPDTGGLTDFHACTPDVIWREQMAKSFTSWLNIKLVEAGFSDSTQDSLEQCDRVMKAIESCGRGDLFQISRWLHEINLSGVAEADDAASYMLGNLDAFDVPVLSSFPLRLKSKKLEPYFNQSLEFFNYIPFLDTTKRKKAQNTIDKILALISDGEDTNLPLDDSEIYPPYATPQEFIEGLQHFISTDDHEERSKLMQCDFVVIADKILKFKKTAQSTKKGARKIKGNPIDVFLTAIWMTLRDFYTASREDIPSITTIKLHACEFKHDIDNGANVDENSELGEVYLKRLLGGVDTIITKYLDLKNNEGATISLQCDSFDTDVSCIYGKNSESCFSFSISVSGVSKDVTRRYAWPLPEHHMYRLSVDLLQRAEDAIANLQDTYTLPVFHMAYYDEALQASGDEEIRRVVLHSIRDEHYAESIVTNLLGGEYANEADDIAPKLKQLAAHYSVFLSKAANSGLFSTLCNAQDTAWIDLRKAYVDIFESFAKLEEVDDSIMVRMLVRAFLIVGKRSHNDSTWHVDKHEPSAIATILHPTVIDMLEAQSLYLFQCFNYVCNREINRETPSDAFKPHMWNSYKDMAGIQSPISCLLHNEDANLTTDVRGHDLIHCIGNTTFRDNPLSTRLLIQPNENADEEDVATDSAMFRETSESKVLLRLLLDYFDLHQHARDGLNIAIYRNNDIQPIIAAIHAYLKILATKPKNGQKERRYILRANRKRPYAISVTILTESHDDSDISSWVQQWKDRWEAAETEVKYELYRYCRFSIAHRIIEKDNKKSLHKLLNEQFEADIAVFYDFISSDDSGKTFEKVAPFDSTSRNSKFPILEKIYCTVDSPAERFRRKRIINNRQFTLTAHHANFLHSLKKESHQKGTLVLGAGDFTQWRNTIDLLHKKTEWVVCVDPSIDERLIRQPASETEKAREIVGFGSGVGTHGENNYTVSTEQLSLADIQLHLCTAIEHLYSTSAGWTKQECALVSEGILANSTGLSGMSLVRATGVGDEYVRDFMAYTLARRIVQLDPSTLCEFAISLDAYRHWFDLADDASHPDLLWVQVYMTEKKTLDIRVQLIECKLGFERQEHIKKAMHQINNGLHVLRTAFASQEEKGCCRQDERPDKRYWWMQLHRLIASKITASQKNYREIVDALEKLSEGVFSIQWTASIFAFWINNKTEMETIGSWDLADGTTASAYAFGGGYVLKSFTNPQEAVVDWEALHAQPKTALIIDENTFEDDSESLFDTNIFSDDEENEEEPDDTFGSTFVPFSVRTAEEPSNLDSFVSLEIDDSLLFIPSSEQELIDETVIVPIDGEPQTLVPQKPQPLEKDCSNDASEQGRILLGTSIPHGNPVYWEFMHQDLSNRHMLIFGSSGQGKTYAIQALLCEMSKSNQASLIVDYTNGFLPNALEKETKEVLDPKQHVVRQNPLPINPFLPQESDNGGIFIKENANAIAQRIASIFDSVYSSMGDQQYSALYNAIMTGVEQMKEDMSLTQMIQVLQDMAEEKESKSYAKSLISKLQPFINDTPFASGASGMQWGELLDSPESLCNIFQLVGLSKNSQRLITEFILWDLYGYLQATGSKIKPKVIVLDEVQNLDHREGSPLEKYLREGRKFGISLILATQIMSSMKKDERDRMFNAGHKLFFKPADTEVKAFAEILAVLTKQKTEDWVKKLSQLSKGECYSVGSVLNSSTGKLEARPMKIRITALEERNFHG